MTKLFSVDELETVGAPETVTGLKSALPRADLSASARRPKGAFAAEVTIDAAFVTERLDAVDRPTRSLGKAQRLFFAEMVDQGVELVVPTGGPTAVATARPEAALFALDENDLCIGRTFSDLDRSPQSGVATSDDADVCADRIR